MSSSPGYTSGGGSACIACWAFAAAAAAAACVVGCNPPRAEMAQGAPPPQAAPPQAAPPSPSTQTSVNAGPPPSELGPQFIEDDVATALAVARGGGKVVFVDAWAPWCHTCLSMQRDVLARPALARLTDRVVFVAVDTDRAENVDFLARHPVRVWPTFFVLDPNADAPLAVRPGSMSLEETIAFVEGALAARDPTRTADPQALALSLAHAAGARQDTRQAGEHFLTAASHPGPRRAEAILGAMRVLEDPARCVGFGLQHLRDVIQGGAPGDVAASVMACAVRLPHDAPLRREATGRVKERLLELVARPPPGAAVDDRADVLAQLAELHEASGDRAAFVGTHEARLKLLEEDARLATTVEAARVHDYARMGSYLALGRGDAAVTMLVERTRQLPSSYEAWARLASTLFKLGRHAEARAAADKAVDLSYGARRLRYLTLRADIAAGEQDVAAERAALRRIVAEVETESSSAALQVKVQGADGLVTLARQRLERLATTTP